MVLGPHWSPAVTIRLAILFAFMHAGTLATLYRRPPLKTRVHIRLVGPPGATVCTWLTAFGADRPG